MNARQLREEREKLRLRMVALDEEIGDKVWTDAQGAQWQEWTDQIRALDARIKRKEDLEAPEPALTEFREIQPYESNGGSSDQERNLDPNFGNDSPEHRFLEFHNWVMTGENFEGRKVRGYRARPPIQEKGAETLRKSIAELAAGGNSRAREFLANEASTRAMNVGTAGTGGATVPDEAMRPLVEAMKRHNGVLNAGVTIINSATGADLPIPSDNDTGNKSSIVAESGSVAFTDVTTTQVVMKAYKHATGIKFTLEFAQDTSIDLVSWIMRKLGTRFGRGQGENMTDGSGTAGEQGIVTGAYASAPTTLAATVTAPTFAHFTALRKALDGAYQGDAVYMFNQNVEVDLLTIVSPVSNRPLWIPSLAPGIPDRILGKNYFVNDFMDDYGSDNVPMIYGAMENFHVRFASDIEFYNMNEKFIDAGELAVVAFSRSDSRMVDAGTHPIVKLTIS